MIRSPRLLAGGAAALLVLGLGAWSLSSGPSPVRDGGSRPHASKSVRTAMDSPAVSVDSAPVAAVPAVARSPVPGNAEPQADALAARARSLMERLRDLPHSEYEVPEELRDAVLAFLEESREARDALFALSWEKETPGFVRGRLVQILTGLDGARGETLLAALNAFDPDAAVRAEMTALARKADELALWLERNGDATARAARIRQIPRDSVNDPALVAVLQRVARDDDSEAVRVETLWILASARAAGVPAFLGDRAVDMSRSLKERNAAAYSLGIHQDGLSAEELLSVFDRLPVESRVFLYRTLGFSDGDGRVDDLLLAGITNDDVKIRRMAAQGLGIRIERLKGDASLDVASRAATLLRGMDETHAETVLNGLGSAVISRSPLSEVVAELHRASREGGPIRTAIAASPVLRRAIGY